MSTGLPATPDRTTSCRLCQVRCDKIVYPSGCVESGCERLYAYDESGRRYVGCLDRIFGVEIDLRAFQELQRTRVGFGALRALREPHSYCRSDVDAAFEHRADRPCANPEFLVEATSHRLKLPLNELGEPDD